MACDALTRPRKEELAGRQRTQPGKTVASNIDPGINDIAALGHMYLRADPGSDFLNANSPGVVGLAGTDFAPTLAANASEERFSVLFQQPELRPKGQRVQLERNGGAKRKGSSTLFRSIVCGWHPNPLAWDHRYAKPRGNGSLPIFRRPIARVFPRSITGSARRNRSRE